MSTSFPSLPEPPPQTLAEKVATEARPAREAPSKGRLFLVLVVSIALLSGVAALGYWLFQPAPCSGRSFVSTQFGYCVNAPQGWTAVPDESSTVPSDSFFLPDGAATVTVRSVDIPSLMDLNAFGKTVYELDQRAGYDVGQPAATRVGSQPAIQWDLTATDQRLMSREVVVVKDGHAWRITLSDTEASFSRDTAALRQLLDSWQFD